MLMWGGYTHGMMYMMGYGWWFMLLIPIAFLVLIAIGAYYLITELSRRSSSGTERVERPLEILKERYAKGEITREQYLKMKEDLES
ncbi:MAG: SHOCT domain-containing protein [Candidatus Brockarchaeota archaeon]|nr:SHOCT domain-containing protein [Candidatus Brockarchaeota archaeon]